MRPPIRLAHFMFLFGLIMVMGPEDGPIWPKVIGLVLFLWGMGIMRKESQNKFSNWR